MALSFTIQADHPRNADLLLQSIPNCRLRSNLVASRPALADEHTGESPGIPKDQARHLGSLPPVPGMMLTVNPKERTYTIHDPIHGDTKFCDRLHRALRQDGRPTDAAKIDGVPPVSGELDIHRMKTLCRELFQLKEEGHVQVVKGICPDMEDIDDLDGKYLLNPGCRVHNNQPTFEEDMPDYIANLQATGG